GQLDRFVLLPEQLDQQKVTWDTVGLSPAQLPAELTEAGIKPSAPVYHVAGERFQASLQEVHRTSAAARVKLAALHPVWYPDGTYQAVAALDLEPGGLNACVLELPAGCRLVHASVERLPALIDPLGQGRWRLALGPQQLPQHIELIYSGSVAGSGVQKQFQAPRLADIGVDQTLWTIYGPPSMGDAEPRQSTWHVHAVQQQLTRLQN